MKCRPNETRPPSFSTASIAGIGNVCTVTPNVSQWLVRLIHLDFPVKSVMRLQKLVGEISICCMDLDSVESCPEDSVASRLGVQLHVFPDLFHRQRTWGWRRGRRITFGVDIGIGLGATSWYPPSSRRTSGCAVRPSAMSWRKMNDPFLCTASTICQTRRRAR